MKLLSSTSNYTIGVLFLILLSSHEIIIHARNIERHADFMEFVLLLSKTKNTLEYIFRIPPPLFDIVLQTSSLSYSA